MTPRLFAILALFLPLLPALVVPQAALAGCTDPATPEVNWRRCFHDGRPLVGVDLTKAQLRDATFQRSDLTRANLTGADAYRAKFVSATLPQVVFDGARLIEADFTRADLTAASLRGADLRNAKLVGADLRGADLTGARLEGTDLRNANLSMAVWLDGTRVCAEGSVGQCN